MTEPAAPEHEPSPPDLLDQSAWQLDVEPETLRPGPAPAEAAPVSVVKVPAETPPPPPRRILEALLFVGGTPLTLQQAAAVMRGLTPEQFHEIIDTLNHAYREQGRPYHLEKRETGVVLTLRPGYRFLAEKLYGGTKEARLSLPAVDVLAIVAYRQPVTKQEIDNVRGHESGALLRQLIRRNLLSIVSRAVSGGREVQYGTTQRFLELFGLDRLDDLPETEDLQKL